MTLATSLIGTPSGTGSRGKDQVEGTGWVVPAVLGQQLHHERRERDGAAARLRLRVRLETHVAGDLLRCPQHPYEAGRQPPISSPSPTSAPPQYRCCKSPWSCEYRPHELADLYLTIGRLQGILAYAALDG